MKIRSLLLGSVAAAGLSTGAFAADLGVMTSLDVCDALGLTGITISSDTNCLQITGEVKYEFAWGDYKGNQVIYSDVLGGYGDFTIPDNDAPPGFPDVNLDWDSKVEAYLKFVGTADSDFGPAKVVIKIKDVQQYTIRNENNLGPDQIAGTPPSLRAAGADAFLGNADDIFVTPGPNGVIDTEAEDAVAEGDDVTVAAAPVSDDYSNTGGDHTNGPKFDEAYVSVGDSTVLMAGKKGSIMELGDDEPFNWLGLFQSEKVDKGVKWRKDYFPDGGHVIQIVHDLGNGLSLGAGLEKLDGVGATAGTAVGVIKYAGDGITAHATVVAGGVLDGTVERWGYHAGFTGTFDNFKVRGAIAGDYDEPSDSSYWNALASAEATFDMFKLAISGEAASLSSGGASTTMVGAGGSITATVTEGISINLGGRFFDEDIDAPDTEGYQVAAQLVAAVTETLTLTGEIGAFGENTSAAPDYTNVYYGAVTVAWAPGGGFTSSLKGEAYSNGGYKATFKAAKSFE